ncbi:alkaline phosphatase D family protein [Massilia sp. GCM10023247]|uniref:alkaline phosphatase D family protein n=1 Tax=Massilia sp. GCM10023247 TaxID=3252643 RepID=UPI0036167121
MAQSSGVPVRSPEDGRFWTDGWDGYPLARRRLLDALVKSGAGNPLVLAGDVHTFYASELRRDFRGQCRPRIRPSRPNSAGP